MPITNKANVFFLVMKEIHQQVDINRSIYRYI